MPTVDLTPGDQGNASLVVGNQHLATTLGSGREAVFATPALVALVEAAAVACVEDRLAPGHVSLGIRIAVDHIAPSPLGRNVKATATLTEIKGRRLVFTVSAEDESGAIARGEHIRAVVEAETFRARFVQK